MSSKLHVRNLSHTIRDAELRRLFEPHGGVCSARVLDYLKTGMSTVSGLVEMNSEGGAKLAMAELNGRAYHGHTLRVSRATPGQWDSFSRSRASAPASTAPAKTLAPCRGPRPGGFGDRGGHRPRGGRFSVFAESDRLGPEPAPARQPV